MLPTIFVGAHPDNADDFDASVSKDEGRAIGYFYRGRLHVVSDD